MSQLIGARSVFAVQNLESSTSFYIEALGFHRDFGDGSDGWSFLSRDNVRVMLGECPDELAAYDIGNHSYVLHILTDDVDALHTEFDGNAVDILSPPEDKPWGIREFSIRTPDGHRMVFGQPRGGM